MDPTKQDDRNQGSGVPQGQPQNKPADQSGVQTPPAVPVEPVQEPQTGETPAVEPGNEIPVTEEPAAQNQEQPVTENPTPGAV